MTSSIEGLKRGIEDMLAQGEPAADSDPEATQFIEGLGRKVRNMSDAEVALRLEKLDLRMHGLFSRMMPLIEWISAGEARVDDRMLAEASNDIDALKRMSRTALALRGMLARRGLSIPAFRLPLDRAKLQKKLFAIAREEQQARREVIQQVRAMGNDVRMLLERTDLSAAMRQLLEQLQTGLLANLEHLRAGHGVAELPLPIETADFGIALPEADQASSEEDEPVVVKPTSSSTVTGGSQAPVEATPDSDKPSLPGMFRSVWLWFKSPWEVSWRDIRQGRYRG
ncbi:hypothetical protein RE428_16010 [Marinobacter nanhaiticus D15-8W]|uniref:Uncharacterized protein n=2 Tax=Marinobacter TaxID=2742 RepID=N6WQB8_9GAMM|nr:hypothetical protein J057_17540 [Marinobacter nanhaiticus D15-8W]BES70583.1 hypothetical protein RE428_16010 [Marinobacter nanhaiticus D15-8W]